MNLHNAFTMHVAVTAALGAAFGATCAAPAGPPDAELSILVQQGDVIDGGYGTVSNINDISINNNGDWIVDVSLSGGSTSRALLLNGDVWLANGDPIDPNDTVSSVANQLKSLNNLGDVSLRLSLNDNHSGIYLNFEPLLLRDQISTAPQFSPNTPYIGFFRSRVNDEGDVLAVVTASDSELPGSVHRALVWLSEDPGTGALVEDVVMKRHDPAPGTEPGVEFDQVNSGADDFVINNNGDVLFSAPFNNAPSDTNGGLYYNDTLVVRKGDPSPVSGSDYANIGSSSTRVGMNDLGDYVFMSTLTNQPTETNTLIAHNNIFTDGPDKAIIQRGDPVPGLADRDIDSLGTGAQPRVTNAGEFVWYARFTGEDATNQGLFINSDLIMQKGVTTVDGNLIDTLAGTTGLSNGLTQGFVTSDDGNLILVRVRFANGDRAAVLVDRSDDECAVGDVNCDGVVNVDDLLIVLNNWGDCDDCRDCEADLNGDCVVNVDDLLTVLNNWG